MLYTKRILVTDYIISVLLPSSNKQALSAPPHLSPPRAPGSSGWSILRRRRVCRWWKTLHTGCPAWRSCWTVSCSCGSDCFPCCRRPPPCSRGPPRRGPTCWAGRPSCSRLRSAGSGEYTVLETRWCYFTWFMFSISNKISNQTLWAKKKRVNSVTLNVD